MKQIVLGATRDGKWEPGIGDPTVIGWFTVFAYFLAAYLCWARARRCRIGQSKENASTRSDYVFWIALTIILALLGVNKQLDLQTAITEYARGLAHAEGWYDQRRLLQEWFVGIIALTSFFVCFAVAFFCRGVVGRHRLASIGMAMLVSFVVIRAASFHHIDLLLGSDPFGLPVNAILELSGISCIALGAWNGLFTQSAGRTR